MVDGLCLKQKIFNMNTSENNSLGGYATFSGDGSFAITVTHPDYTPAEVKELLKDGDIGFTYGDTRLFDGNEQIATIDWDMDIFGTDEITFDDEEDCDS